MTDKEFRKLSRLELLELLLGASKENEELREKVEKLKKENEAARSIENLSLSAKELTNALRYANNLTDNLSKNITATLSDESRMPSGTAFSQNSPSEKTDSRKDIDLYCRLMSYYAKNRDALNSLPEEMGNSIRERIREIIEDRKTDKR